MLLLDAVESLSENAIVCRKTFRDDEFFFQGHYPGQPIVPGFILCECAAQAGALLAAHSAGMAPPGVPLLTRAGDIRFKQVVRPGETIEIHVQRDEQIASATYFSAKILKAGKLAVGLTFAALRTEGP
jgi:3-hydroxyacyl-[acyl-carrier-protein] dehydratase